MSLGGYLKLGWRSQPALNRYIFIARPLSFIQKSLFNCWWKLPNKIGVPKIPLKHEDFSDKFWQQVTKKSLMVTTSHEYLHWRFCKNPRSFYGIVTEGKDQILYRVVKKGSIKTIELVLWTQYEFNNLEKKLIDKIVKLELPDMITIVASSESFILPSTKNFLKHHRN